MKKIVLALSFMAFQSCAVFHDVNNHLSDSTHVGSKLKDIGFELIVEHRYGSRLGQVTLDQTIINELKKNGSCDLSVKSDLFKNKVYSENSFATRVACEFSELIIKNDYFSKKSNAKARLQVRIIVDDKSSISKKIWEWTNIFTFGIVPYWSRKVYSLEAELYIPASKTKRKYKVEKTIVEARQLFLVFTMPFVDGYGRGLSKTHDFLYRKLMEEVVKDL